jgi:predicted TIM-barrel fold metal-dependent hydrolase
VLAAGCCTINPPGPFRPPTQHPGLVVDAHAHVMNGRDLPPYGFAKDVWFHGEVPGGILTEGILKLVEQVIWDSAPSYEQELADLCNMIETTRRTPPALPECASAHAAARVARTTLPPTPDNPTGWSPERARAFVLSRLEADPQLRGDVLKAAVKVAKRPAAARADGHAPRLHMRVAPSADASAAVATESFFEMFGDLVRDLSSPRANNLVALETLYPDVDLYVAAMVDFDKWVGEASLVTLGQQAELMKLLAIASDGRVLPFIAFDPWRDDVTPKGNALRVVHDAVANDGVVGVKLYPPMGFRATGNTQSFEDWEAGLISDGIYDHFGPDADARLGALYGWAARGGVPLLAHTGDTNYSRDSAQTDADPKYWAALFDASPELGDLRLNIGHVGGQGPNDPDKTWRAEVFTLFANHPNVYGDVSCFEPESGAQNGFWSGLAQQAAVSPMIVQRLLYGSDWYLLSDCSVPQTFEKTMHATLKQNFGDATTAQIFGTNAAAFLGLRKNDCTRARLDNFYQKYGVTAAWRGVVDGLPGGSTHFPRETCDLALPPGP